jgi:hypothetical protein
MMIKKLMPQAFNDTLCVLLITMITVMWILAGRGLLELSAEVMGALIVTWTLLVQYYFRKKAEK